MMRRLNLALLCVLSCIFLTAPLHAQEPTPTPIPEPMPLVDEQGYDIINVLLIGSATENQYNPGLTDSLMVVSINRSIGSVSIVSIPRDLYVYEPGFGMKKINQAYFYGETRAVEGGGVGLLVETIRYNLGLEIDYYARVNFNGFGSIIDAVGGINITVDCTIQDWKLKSPELDKHDPDNWEMYTLNMGRHHLDSELALWYVRSRRTSSDIDRGRRQQDVIRALWRTIRQQGLLEQLPTIWGQVTETVDTNLTLTDILGLTPLALTVDTADIEYYTFRLKREINNGYSPDGQFILKPEREAIAALMQNVVIPPTRSGARVKRPTLAVVNASGIPYLSYVVADRLELEGFRTVVVDEWSQPRMFNKIVDYTGASKGNPIGSIQRVLQVTEQGIELSPDPNREYDFKVYIGNNYQYLTCTRNVIQPPAATPTPAPDA